MKRFLIFFTIGLFALVGCVTSKATTIHNINLNEKFCKITKINQDNTKEEFDLPKPGKTSKKDLSNHKGVQIECIPYKSSKDTVGAGSLCLFNPRELIIPIGKMTKITLSEGVGRDKEYPICVAE